MERFWDVSARVARVSGWLVGRLGVRDGVRPDDAYTFGLFRDCGIPILMKKFPQYVAILKEADADLDRVFTDVEQVRCPTNHAIVGSLMAQNWWLPEETSEAIRCHHDAVILASGPLVIAPASARMVALAQLAEFLVQRIDGQSTTREWDKLGCTCRQLLALDAEGAIDQPPAAGPSRHAPQRVQCCSWFSWAAISARTLSISRLRTPSTNCWSPAGGRAPASA